MRSRCELIVCSMRQRKKRRRPFRHLKTHVPPPAADQVESVKRGRDAFCKPMARPVAFPPVTQTYLAAASRESAAYQRKMKEFVDVREIASKALHATMTLNPAVPTFCVPQSTHKRFACNAVGMDNCFVVLMISVAPQRVNSRFVYRSCGKKMRAPLSFVTYGAATGIVRRIGPAWMTPPGRKAPRTWAAASKAAQALFPAVAAATQEPIASRASVMSVFVPSPATPTVRVTPTPHAT